MNDIRDLFKANEDILCTLYHTNSIGWGALKKQSIQRIMYLIQVLYGFSYEGEPNAFSIYHFSTSLYGPYSRLIDRSIVYLESNLFLKVDESGSVYCKGEALPKGILKHKNDWIRQVVFLLGIYGEERLFGFVIADPQYKDAVDTNRERDLDAFSNTSKTLVVIHEFKDAFEETLTDTALISKEEYLELYFEFIFSSIVKGD